MTTSPKQNDSTSSNQPMQNKRRTVSYLELFRYATSWDYCLLAVAVLMACIRALTQILTTVTFCELVAMLVSRSLGIGTSSKSHALVIFGGGAILTNATHEVNMRELRKDSIAFGILMVISSLILFISGIAFVDLFNHVALRQVLRMRRKFLEAIIRQDIGWHDTAKDQNFAVRITDNMEKIRDGISEKLGHFLRLGFEVIAMILLSFSYGWKMTLAVSGYIPITIICNHYVTKYQTKLTAREQSSYVKASSVAEEVIAAIRTVVAFDGGEKESKRHDDLLIPARNASKWKGALSGFGEGLLQLLFFLCSSLGFWYGTHLIISDRSKDLEDVEYNPAVVAIIIFATIIGADNISKTSPYREAFAMACGSAIAVFDVIDDSSSKIDPMSSEGKTLGESKLKGNIEFQSVFFRYPSREDVIVLRDFNLIIEEGQTVALVGSSGSGKSTCVQLLQRFYDPISGKIIIDGLNIKLYNTSWLRSNLAVVGQEPVLFQGTIGDNIRHGKFNATEKEIEDAAKAAGAHDFIVALPDSYNTLISEKGVQLSGGQRQRIAIARALVGNPKILLLDEATSALDYHSERLVQEALDKASKGRTTIVVSHRLSAIRHADRIVFIDHGRVIEEGSHEQLMKLSGKYYEMVTASEYEGNNEYDNDENDLNVVKPFEMDWNHLSRRRSVTSIGKNIISALVSANSTEEHKDTQLLKTFLRILLIAKPEWCLLILATVCAALYGLSQPVMSIIYAEFYAALAIADKEQVFQRTEIISIGCIAIGIILCVACFLQTYLFNLSGVLLTTRIRSMTFKSVISQEIAWYDDDNNSVGTLSARLSGDTSSVQGSIGYPLSAIIQAVTNLLCSIIIALYYSWQLALACLCTSPLMVASTIFEAKFATKSLVLEKQILEETSRIATESITQIRTVAALRREPKIIEEYDKELNRYERQIRKRLRFRGIVNSSSVSIMLIGYAITMTYGGILCSEGKIAFQDILKVSESLLFCLLIFAQALAFTPAFTTALIAGHRLFAIVDRKSSIQSPARHVRLSKPDTKEGVTYENVNFRYPKRPGVKVLHDLSLEVFQGKTVALVGSSGCGKSTCIQLLQRFYDPNAGKIFIDQDDIQRDMDLPALRRRLGIVSQEPSLFEKTIAENIAYGDTSRDVPLTEIIEAAKMANAHSFIAALPLGYDTCLGARGTQLSGGQKQRIAIARALVRNPKILLLDEATSALDLQSERIVQSALDEACSGRTCIVIAHRLTTVQNADLICVLQNGRIVEQGNHPQLLAKNGIYARLHRNQPNAQ